MPGYEACPAHADRVALYRLPFRPIGEHAVDADDSPAGEAEQRGQERQRDENRDRDRRRGGETHYGQERDVDDREADEGDNHGEAGEDDRAPGGSGRLGGRLTKINAVGDVLAMAREDE